MATSKPMRMVGVDVSATWVEVSRGAADEAVATRQCANTAGGHRELARWLTQGGRRARVVLEATGLYSLDVALTLERTPGIEVMVLNPRVSKEFAGAWGSGRAPTQRRPGDCGSLPRGCRSRRGRRPVPRPWRCGR